MSSVNAQSTFGRFIKLQSSQFSKQLRRGKKSKKIQISSMVCIGVCCCVCNFIYARLQLLKLMNTPCSIEIWAYSLYSLLNSVALWTTIGFHYLEGKYRFRRTITQIDKINMVLMTFNVTSSPKKYDRMHSTLVFTIASLILIMMAHLVFKKEEAHAEDSFNVHSFFLLSALIKTISYIWISVMLITDIFIVKLTTDQIVILWNLKDTSFIYRKIHCRIFEVSHYLSINSGLILLAIIVYNFGHIIFFAWSEIKPELSCLMRVSPYSSIGITMMMVLAILYFMTQAKRIVSNTFFSNSTI